MTIYRIGVYRRNLLTYSTVVRTQYLVPNIILFSLSRGVTIPAPGYLFLVRDQILAKLALSLESGRENADNCNV